MSAETETGNREEILSREETDALLQGIDDGSVPTESGRSRPANEVLVYDFAECERLALGTLPTLQIINTRIARRLRDSLGDLFRKPVEVDCGDNVLRRFADHMPTIQMPASLNLVRIPPLNGTMMIVPETRLVYMTVDCFFGGTGKIESDPPAREFTQVERRMVSLLLERIFEAISEGWEPVIELEPELIGQEQNPQFASIASSNEQVIVTEFVIRVAEEEVRLQFVIPRSLIEPVEDLLDSGPRNDDAKANGQWSSALRDRLQDTRIGLHTTLTRATLRLGDVLNLQPGDVIPVDLPDEVFLEAAGTAIFAGRVGVSRNRNAVEIIARTKTSLPAIQHREKHS